jgi:hypothetical protein
MGGTLRAVRTSCVNAAEDEVAVRQTPLMSYQLAMNLNSPQPVPHIVITVHGILTLGRWQECSGALLRLRNRRFK